MSLRGRGGWSRHLSRLSDDALNVADFVSVMNAQGTGDVRLRLIGNIGSSGLDDGSVLFLDNLTLLGDWVGLPGDINGDAVIDVGDLAVVGAQWGSDGSGHPLGWSADVAPMPNGDGGGGRG